jgi:hypothetical protein
MATGIELPAVHTAAACMYKHLKHKELGKMQPSVSREEQVNHT